MKRQKINKKIRKREERIPRILVMMLTIAMVTGSLAPSYTYAAGEAPGIPYLQNSVSELSDESAAADGSELGIDTNSEDGIEEDHTSVSESERENESEIDSQDESESRYNPEEESESVRDSETESIAETERESESETESETESESESESEFESEADETEEENSDDIIEENGFYTVTSDGIVTIKAEEGTNVRVAFQAGVRYAEANSDPEHRMTVMLPQGKTYTLSGPVYVVSNVIVDLNGSTITYNSKGQITTLFRDTRTADPGYTRVQNFTLRGGTLLGDSESTACMIHIGHCQNLVIEDMTFTNVYSPHVIEILGVNDLTIQNCTFQDLYIYDVGGNEAIQLEVLADSMFGGDGLYDGTINQNVKILNNQFINCVRGVGVHNQLLGSYHKGLEITGNTFRNLSDAAVYLQAYTDIDIHHNIIENCAQGIWVTMIRKNGYRVATTIDGKPYTGTIVSNANTRIHDNEIKLKITNANRINTPIGICLFGQTFSQKTANVPAGSYRITGVKIYNNNITTGGYGIQMYDAGDTLVENNTIAYKADAGARSVNYNGVDIHYGTTGNIIRNNQITNFSGYGIGLSNSAVVDTINENTLKCVKSNGIAIKSSTVKKTVSSNTITFTGSGTSARGIWLFNSTVPEINSNSLTNVAGRGISVNGGKVTNINSNYIFKASDYAIVVEDTTAAKVSDNTIYTPVKKAIKLYGSGKITNNTNNHILTTAFTKTQTVAVNGTSGVKISWNKSTGVEGYYVYRKTADSDYTRIAVVKGDSSLTYVDKTAEVGVSYTYAARAYCGTLRSSYTTASVRYVAAPTVKVSNAASGINVTWNAIEGAGGYHVYRKVSGGSYSRLAAVTDGNTNSYLDQTAKAGTTYVYTVRAYCGNALSAFTGVTIVRLTNPAITLTKATAGVRVSWKTVAGASGYYVYRKTGSGNYTRIATITKSTTLYYVDKTAKTGTTYTYTVRAVKGSSLSAFTGTSIKR